MRKHLSKAILIGIAVLALFVGGCSCSITSSEVTDNSVTALRYDGGTTSGRKFKECVPAGTKLATDDDLYPYPNTQRQDMWDSANSQADHGDLGSEKGASLTDNSGVQLTAKVNVQFFLNTSCEPVEVNGKEYKGGTLQVYHELVGKTRHAYFKNDGTYGQGWITAMDYYISAPVTKYINNATKKYSAQQLWVNQKVDENGVILADQSQPGTPVQDYIGNALTEALPGLVNAGMETDLQFYENFNVSVISVTPDSTFLDLFKARQKQQVESQTALDNAQAQIDQANANADVATAQAKQLQEVIKGYGSVDAYLQYLAIQSGLNPFPYTGGLVTTGATK